MTVTRRDIRRQVADRLDDIKILTARADSGGFSTFTDEVELTDAQNAYLASQAMPTGGTALNLGRIVRVLGSDAATHTLTVTPELPAMPMTGDEWELVNLNGKGWRFQDYHRFINQVLADSMDMGLVATSETIDDFDEDDGQIEIPASLETVSGVFLIDGNDLTAIPRARRPGPYNQGYWIDRSTGTLRIEGGYRSYAAGGSLVLRGTGPHAQLNTDEDVCSLPTTWLIPEIAGRMAESASLNDNRRQALADRLRGQAQQARDLARPLRSPNSWRVR